AEDVVQQAPRDALRVAQRRLAQGGGAAVEGVEPRRDDLLHLLDLAGARLHERVDVQDTAQLFPHLLPQDALPVSDGRRRGHQRLPIGIKRGRSRQRRTVRSRPAEAGCSVSWAASERSTRRAPLLASVIGTCFAAARRAPRLSSGTTASTGAPSACSTSLAP